VSTALPSIAGEFHVSQADYNWIGSAYLLACAASTPSWGKISDIFGRKPILIVANVVFLIGSLLCALSVNQRMLIGGRSVQGIGGGGLLSLVNICVADLFSQRYVYETYGSIDNLSNFNRARGTYYGWVGGTWAVAGALGPILGGVFSEYATWR
jgi:MFS family permease